MARIYLNDNWSFYEDAANPKEAVEVRNSSHYQGSALQLF